MSGAAPPTKKKLVLIADDDAAIRVMLERALKSRYVTETVADGAAALVRLSMPPVPDLLLCDLMMPGADGMTIARRARVTAATRNLPIVFLTARTAPADFIAGIQAGAKHYITKPFVLADLLAKVSKILGE